MTNLEPCESIISLFFQHNITFPTYLIFVWFLLPPKYKTNIPGHSTYLTLVDFYDLVITLTSYRNNNLLWMKTIYLEQLLPFKHWKQEGMWTIKTIKDLRLRWQIVFFFRLINFELWYVWGKYALGVWVP